MLAISFGVRIAWEGERAPSNPFVGRWSTALSEGSAAELHLDVRSAPGRGPRVIYGYRGKQPLVARASISTRAGRQQMNWSAGTAAYYRVVSSRSGGLIAERFGADGRQVFELRVVEGAAKTPLYIVLSLHLIGHVFMYLALAGAIALCVTRIVGKRFPSRWVTSQRVDGQTRKELLRSARTVAIYSLVGVGVIVGGRAGMMLVYSDLHALGWSYWWISLVVLLLLHDAYFYWTHRLMHLEAFRWIGHTIHHESRSTSAWTTYSFSIPEALVQAAFVPLVLLFVPIHGGALIAFIALALARTAVSHSGVEVLWSTSSTKRAQSTNVRHHADHHRNGRENFGLYLTWWDAWMGTLSTAVDLSPRGLEASAVGER